MGGPDNGEPTGSAGLEVDEHAIGGWMEDEVLVCVFKDAC